MPTDKAMALTTKIERELSLTKDQKALVFDLLLVRSEQGQKLVKNNPNNNDKQNQIARINNKARKDLKKVLTQDHYATFTLLREALKSKRPYQEVLPTDYLKKILNWIYNAAAMTSKLTTYITSLLILCTPLMAVKCVEQAPEPVLTELEKLPPATHSGKHTMGFLLNGRAWEPHSTVNYHAHWADNHVNIGGGGYVGKGQPDETEVGIVMYINDLDPFRIRAPYDLADSATASPRLSIRSVSGLICKYRNDVNVLEGELLITHYILEKRIMAGTFWATFVNENCDTARVTNGRFDLKFTY